MKKPPPRPHPPGPARRPEPVADPAPEAPADRHTSGPSLGEGSPGRAWPLILVSGFVVMVLALLVGLVLVRGDDSGPEATPANIVPPDRPNAGEGTGSYARSRILPNGEIEVTQWIHAATPLRSIDLRMPTVARGANGRATDVTVAVGRTLVEGPTSVGGQVRRYAFPSPATGVFLRYRLTDVVDRSPSAPGRALARVTSLIPLGDVTDGPTRIDIEGAEVMSAACTAEATSSGAPHPCGAPAPGRRWRVTLYDAQRAETVQAQVNLT